MARYEISLADGFGHELHRLIVNANSLPLALLAGGMALEERGLPRAVDARVSLLGVYDQEAPAYTCRVDESAGQEELHSVRAELHEQAAYERDLAAGRVTPLTWPGAYETNERGLAHELGADPSTEKED